MGIALIRRRRNGLIVSAGRPVRSLCCVVIAPPSNQGKERNKRWILQKRNMLWKLWKGVSYVDFKRYIEYITI